MPESSAYRAGFLKSEAQRTNIATGLAGATRFAGQTYNDISGLMNTYMAQEDEKLSRFAGELLDGTSGGEGEATEGIIESTYKANAGNPDGMYDAFQKKWDETMTVDMLMKSGASKRSVERWLKNRAPEMKAQYDLMTERLQAQAIRNKTISTEDARQKLILTEADTWEEAEKQIRDGYESSGIGKVDNGALSLDNAEHRVSLMNSFADVRGRKYIEEMSASTDMTFDEMTDEVLKEYDRQIGKLDLSGSPEAGLLAKGNRETLKTNLRNYAAQVAGNLTQEAEAKAVRFQNDLTALSDSGQAIDNETWMKLERENFISDNIYDREQMRNLRYSQFGYDINMSGRFDNVNAIIPGLLPKLYEYRSAEASSTEISVFDTDVSDTIATLGDESGLRYYTDSLTLNTRYGGLIQELVDEYGFDKEEAEYLSRSLNQYVSTSEQWASDKWKKSLSSMAANPKITTEEYMAFVENLHNSGAIDADTYNSFINKKDSPYQKYIDKATDYIKNRIDIAFAGDDDYTSTMRWKELVYRNDFTNNIEQLIVREKNLGSSDQEIDQAVSDYAAGLITIMCDDDVSNLVYKSTDRILETIGNYRAGIGFSLADSSLQEVNEMYLNSAYASVFNESAVATGQLYLQGSPSTRTADGLYDSVAKAMYGDSAKLENLTPTEQEIVKANGAVALAQFYQYESVRKVFGGIGTPMKGINVDGYGMASMDDEGFIYRLAGDSTIALSYVSDSELRRNLLSGNVTDIDLDGPGIITKIYRLKDRIEYEEEDSGLGYVDPVTANDPFVDQFSGMDTSMVDRPDPSVEYRIYRESQTPYLRPNEDPGFIGLKKVLKKAGGRNAVQTAG